MGSSGSRSRSRSGVAPQLTSRPEGSRSGTKKSSKTKERPKITDYFRSQKKFQVQVRIAGKTGGAEKKFLKHIKKLLSRQGVRLQVKGFTGPPKHLLLVFCPIASRMGTDIENALEGLSGDQKAILVVMHYLPKDNTETFLDTTWQGTHPALVQTVHTRYTLRDGFYPCGTNEVAMADVAAAIKVFHKRP